MPKNREDAPTLPTSRALFANLGCSGPSPLFEGYHVAQGDAPPGCALRFDRRLAKPCTNLTKSCSSPRIFGFTRGTTSAIM